MLGVVFPLFAAYLIKDLENSDTKVLRVQCLFCQSSVVKNVTRPKTHIEQCLSCPQLLKQKFVNNSCKIMNKSDSEESVENWLVNFSSKNLKKKKQSTIINFADKITTQEQKKYDTLLAPAIYASASQLSMVENPHWKSFFNAIRPVYVVPSRYKISEPLLDSEYDKIKVETVATIAASDSAGLMSDR